MLKWRKFTKSGHTVSVGQVVQRNHLNVDDYDVVVGDDAVDGDGDDDDGDVLKFAAKFH